MKSFMRVGNGAKTTGKYRRQARRQQSAAACAFEALEARQLFSVTGLSVVGQNSFPGAPTTVKNEPNIFSSTLENTWQQLIDGQLKIQGQTLAQDIASKVQQGAESLGYGASNITTSFNPASSYIGVLEKTSSGSVLEMSFAANGNETTFDVSAFTSPTFHVIYAIEIDVDLSLPSNLDTGGVTATATARTLPTRAWSNNVFVSQSDVVSVFNAFATSQNVSSIVPTTQLSAALGFEALAGYNHMDASVDPSGTELVLTLEKPTLTVNGSRNDHISISSGSKGSVVITAGGQTETIGGGYLKSIVVDNDGAGTNTVDIPSLPAGIAVQVNYSNSNTDSVAIGGAGSLANVAGTIGVTNSSSRTSITVDDSNDSAASDMTVTGSAVEFKGRTLLTYSAGKGDTSLKVNGGPHGSDITVVGTASGVPTTIQTGSGQNNKVTIDGSSSALTVFGNGGTVTVGNGSLAAIGGTVYVSNLGNVDIGDYNDRVSRTVDLTSTTSFLGASSAVAFQGLATIDLGYVKGVRIDDGYADDTFDAEGSPFNDFFTIDGHYGDSLTGPAASQVKFVKVIRLPVVTPMPIMP